MNYIKNIVVADDESIQCEILCQILSDMIPEAVVHSAKNGMEAYQYIQQHAVDVLITDILMPVMDGMELIQKIAEEKPEIKIVLISAYQEFEYARNAIKYGVFDYLVKPFRVETIARIIDKINVKIGEAVENSQQITYYEKIVQLYNKDHQMEKLSLVIKGIASMEEVDQSLYQTIARPGVLLLLRWKRKTGSKKEWGLTEFQQEKLLQGIAEAFPKGYLVPLDKGLDNCEYRVALIAPEVKEQQAVAFMEHCLKEAARKQIIFWCGISGECKNMAEEISKAVEEAEEMITFSFYTRQTGGVFPWNVYQENMDLIVQPVSNIENEIREQIHKGNADTAVEKLNKLEKKYSIPPYITAFRVKHAVSSMIMRIIRDLEGMLSQSEYDELINKAYTLYGVCDSLEELFEISREFLQNEAAYFCQETGNYDAVQDIILYMKKHYSEELSLQDLAEKVHFSANYLSAQIKNRTGMTYVEYLMSLRLEEARFLLLNSNRKVVEIARNCGFNDSSYFNRIFRRMYKISPEQYRKVHKHVEEAL